MINSFQSYDLFLSPIEFISYWQNKIFNSGIFNRYSKSEKLLKQNLIDDFF